MLDSTIWPDCDARTVFITALLMAVPMEVESPMEQLHIRSLEPTGWLVPPEWYGWVAAAGSGIVRRSGIEEQSGLDALERLGAPDLESRSSAFEGRRMVRVNGGFIILNFMRHRERDHTAAERQRRYRERLRSHRDSTTVTRDVTSQPRNITQAEAEAEADLRSTTMSGKPDERYRDAVEVLKILNEVTGSKFRKVDTNLRLISARLNEDGVDLEGVRLMIERQCREWKGAVSSTGKRMETFLRPATLFAKEKFDGYYGAREQPNSEVSGKPRLKTPAEQNIDNFKYTPYIPPFARDEDQDRL